MPHRDTARYEGNRCSRKAYTSKTLTVSSSVVALADDWGFTEAELVKAERCVIVVGSNHIVMTWDSTAPTATLGMKAKSGKFKIIAGNVNIRNVKLIRETLDSDVTIVLESI